MPEYRSNGRTRWSSSCYGQLKVILVFIVLTCLYSSVIQAFLDWGILAQVPSTFEGIGLVIAIAGAVIMAIGDDYIVKPIFYKESRGNLFDALKY